MRANQDVEFAFGELLECFGFLFGFNCFVFEERINTVQEEDMTTWDDYIEWLAFEKSLREECEPFRRVEQPYFVSVHTQGTIRSPYPELSDAEFWLYMTLYGSEQATRQWLEGKMVPSLGWKTTLEYLHDAAHPSLLASIRKRLSSGKANDPHLAAWSAQTDLLYPSYS